MNGGPMRIAAATALLAALALAGCGEKIEMPEAQGLFSVNSYLVDQSFPVEGVNQVAVINNNIFLVAADGSLVKRSLAFEEIARVDGLDEPTALCRDEASRRVFVWEQGAGRLSVFDASDLTELDAQDLPDVRRGAALAVCATGLEGHPDGAENFVTFVYVADPDSGVVHRYVERFGGGFDPAGILCRSDGEGARFVHEPAGLAVDAEGMLLVCDAADDRNWVVRFDPALDLDDETADPDDVDPWRGEAILFAMASCEPPAAADYTLGDAAECGESGWIGAPSDAVGEFDRPLAVVQDGSGRIFVADSGNDRFQVFTSDGIYDMVFGTEVSMPAPSSLALVDWRIGSGADEVNFGAFVLALLPDIGELRKYISSEHYIYINEEPPPPAN